MLVHFVAPQQNILEEIDTFRRIVKTIHEHGHSLTRDWIEPAYEIASHPQKNFAILDWPAIYRENMEAIARADIIIAENTTTNFATGFQTAVGLHQKKPTLLLAREDVFSGTMVSGLEEELVTRREYNDKNLEQIVSEFIEENKVDTKDLRFNFFIDRQIYNYLRWASFKSGKTKAEILRDLVIKEIDKNDY